MEIEMDASEAVRKAAAVEETVNTEGWKCIMEMIMGVLEKEVLALTGQALDYTYYRKVGMIQALKYITELDSLVKNTEVREYLLHQGRALGLEVLKKSPQFFFDGRQQGRAMIEKINGDNNLDLTKKKFTEDVYRQS
jgi:hypothetical protein